MLVGGANWVVQYRCSIGGDLAHDACYGIGVPFAKNKIPTGGASELTHC